MTNDQGEKATTKARRREDSHKEEQKSCLPFVAPFASSRLRGCMGLVIGAWALVIDWSLGLGHCGLVIGASIQIALQAFGPGRPILPSGVHARNPHCFRP